MDGPGDIQIRIRPNGRIYFDGLPDDLLEMAAAMNPADESLARRVELLKQIRADRDEQEQRKE